MYDGRAPPNLTLMQSMFAGFEPAKTQVNRPSDWQALEALVALAGSDYLGLPHDQIKVRGADSTEKWKKAIKDTGKQKVDRLWTSLTASNRLGALLAAAGLSCQRGLFGHEVILGDDAANGIVADVELHGDRSIPISVKHNSREIKCFRICENSVLSATGIPAADQLLHAFDLVDTLSKNGSTWADLEPEKKDRCIRRTAKAFCDHLTSLDENQQTHFKKHILGNMDYWLLSFGSAGLGWENVPVRSVAPCISVTTNCRYITIGNPGCAVHLEMRFDNKDKEIRRQGTQVKFNLVKNAIS